MPPAFWGNATRYEKESKMKARFTLSDTAIEKLRIFCTKNLKPKFDAGAYADGMISEYENWDNDVIFEIRGLHTVSGNPVSIRFDYDADFEYFDATE
jgi:hypothetical protein